jgi:hypothetical protein
LQDLDSEPVEAGLRLRSLVQRSGLCRPHVYMKTTTIRVPADTRDRINALAGHRGASAGELIDELVLEADGRALLAAAEESWWRRSGGAGRL